MSRTLFFAALCVAIVWPGVFQACPAAESPAAKSRAAEQKIEQALESPTSLEFIETPLSDVVEYLKDLHEIEIQIDEKALEDSDIGKDSPVTRNLKGISLRSALRLMLRELELTYTIRHQVLLITTPEEAENNLIAKVYRVSDLITRYDPKPRETPGGEAADYDTIIETITSTVAPTSWQDVGGPGSIAAGTFNNVETLVVSQTYQVHHKIAALLTEIREVTGAKQE